MPPTHSSPARPHRGGWRQALRRVASPLVDLVLPPRCTLCGMELASAPAAALLCPGCIAALAEPARERCRHCGLTVPPRHATSDCPRCRGLRLRFDSVVTLGPYQGPLRECVLRLKRPGHDALATAVGDLLFERHGAALAALDADFVLPVPMHWTRRLWRQANSPDLTAAALAGRLGVTVARGQAVRIRRTRQQGLLLRTERLRNVRGAFRLLPGWQISRAKIVLVDDVVTTGATASELARLLKRSGAARVDVAALARAESGS